MMASMTSNANTAAGRAPMDYDDMETIALPASPVKQAPASPAMSSEQIRSRSSKGWSGSNSSSPVINTKLSTASSSLGIPPLSFRSKPSSAHSPAESTMSTIDAGSPFGGILDQFTASPALHNVSPVSRTDQQHAQPNSSPNNRTTSGSFQILNKKAVSNSPFLTGGNTTSSSSSPTIARKPFSPASVAQQFHQAQANLGYNNKKDGNGSASNSPVIPSSPGRYGLGLLTRAAPTATSHGSPATSSSVSNRPAHKRNHSDAENVNPKGNLDFFAASHGPISAAADAMSPRTLFNAEMAAIGAPPAMDVTSSSSGCSNASESADEDADVFPRTSKPYSSPSNSRKPRASVTNLGNRASVSNSPFVQASAAAPPSSMRVYDLPKARAEHPTPNATPTKRPTAGQFAVASPNAMRTSAARGAAYTQPQMPRGTCDSRNDDDATEHLRDTPVRAAAAVTQSEPLAAVALQRKKSVHWNEVEEVCEFYPETEDGESRRSSAASSVQSNGTDDELEAQRDREEALAIARAAREHVQAQLEAIQHHSDIYDNYRQDSVEMEEDPTVHPAMNGHLAPAGSRDVSISSEHASIVDHQHDVFDEDYAHDQNASDTEDEIKALMREVEAVQLENQQRAQPSQYADEFGIRTPGSSAGPANVSSVSVMSEPLTPQPLNIAGSLSRRGPLPSPPAGKAMLQEAPPTPSSVTSPAMSLGESLLSAGEYSLPDMGFAASPLLNFEELGLGRRESVKRTSAHVVTSSLIPQDARQAKSSTSSAESESKTVSLSSVISTSPPFRLANTDSKSMASSLRKTRPTSAIPALPTELQASAMPLSSTPPRVQSLLAARAIDSDATVSGKSRSQVVSPNRQPRAIIARPPMSPTKISSDEIPSYTRGGALSSSTYSAEPESALDRLVRETAGAMSGLQPPLPSTPTSDGRSRTNSTASSNSEITQESKASSTPSAESRDKPMSVKDEIMRNATRKQKGVSMPQPTRREPRRRSLSTGDAVMDEPQERLRTPSPPPKDRMRTSTPTGSPAVVFPLHHQSDAFLADTSEAFDSIQENAGRKYRVKKREHGIIAYAAGDSKIATVGDAGDIDAGKAWKRVRRASDMHEHRSQIREYKQSSATRERSSGAFFVKIGKLYLNKAVPVPDQPTYLTCEIRNSLTHVATPPCRMSHETVVAQEFELIAHDMLQVTLTFVVRRDPAVDRHLAPPQPIYNASLSSSASRPISQSSSSGSAFKTGLRNLLSSPKKSRSRAQDFAHRAEERVPVRTAPSHPLLDHLGDDGEICRVKINVHGFKAECYGKQLKTIHKCYGPPQARKAVREIGEVEIKLFYLPPLARVPVKDLPQSIDECLSGLSKADKYDVVHYEGVLTQLGADCKSWRRRQMRLQGARLVAFNEITHKPSIVFQISEAIRLDDPEDGEGTPDTASSAASPATFTTAQTSYSGTNAHRRGLSVDDDDEPFSGRPFAFRLVFGSEEGPSTVEFCADSSEQKAKWLRLLRNVMTGASKRTSATVPPYWAQVLHNALRDRAKHAAPPVPPIPTPLPPLRVPPPIPSQHAQVK